MSGRYPHIVKHSLPNFTLLLLTTIVTIAGGIVFHADNVIAVPISATDEAKVPHYYGPNPNWANSPLSTPDAQVVITATNGGSGAAAEAIVGVEGSITSITVTNPGSGYNGANVDIVGSGSGAKAKAILTNALAGVTSVTLTSPGAGYTAPSVTFVTSTGGGGRPGGGGGGGSGGGGGGGGSGAAATAFGGVDQVTIVDGGAGYTFPTVEFDLPDGPNGNQAQGHAEMDANGTITTLVVDSPGSGYTKAPGITVLNGTRFKRIAGATPAVTTATLSIQSIIVNDPGSGYNNPPTVDIIDTVGTGAGATAVATVTSGHWISSIEVTNPGSGYLKAGIRKFVDGLPGLGPTSANNLGQYLPVAVPDTTTFPGTDYYVIALVQYREWMHSDLPNTGTLHRGYVQLATNVIPGSVQLTNALLDGSTSPALMPGGAQAVGVDSPHFLGPVIVAQKDRPVRVTFYNLLPTGAEGDLFLPVDTSFMGAGMISMDAYDPTPTTGGMVEDEVRNPMCDSAYNKTGVKPAGCFKDNRATLHLHGGISPWISDGTPHQWITPASENTSYPQGASVGNVPDMVGVTGVPDCSNPDDGCSTFYWTNQQSGRFMFYHDHAWGITRLNVYAGEAAGYLIQDQTEADLVAAGTIPADQIPLVIQDRTFVPDDTQLYNQYDTNGNVASYGQDPTWDKGRWGGMGSLWYEHVYMPAQNPSDPTGMSTFGRWMYGAWFWPPQNDLKYGPIDNPYFGKDPKGLDGIQGTADDWLSNLPVACNLDDPATWQYQESPFCEPPLIPGTPNNSAGMEQFNDTPIVNGTAYPTVTLQPKAYRFRILNAANDRFFNFQWYVADPNTVSTELNGMGQPIGGTEVALKTAEVAAAQLDPNVFPTPDTAISPAGPSWIQIGSEGGFLPAPVVIPNQPITWITDPTRFDVGNVDKHSLLIAPAERADVVVDFSQFAGKTLILYNDAPAAFPARVASYDYYTGGPDLSPAGAPPTLPGYGPNTRTIMQVKVAAGGGTPFNLSALQGAFRHHSDDSGVFESSQHPIIVGQAGYNSAYGTAFASASWCNDPAADPNVKCDGFARISQQGGDLFTFDTLFGNKLSIPLEPKAIHDEMNAATFDEFGRMTANLGVESVPATPGGQNINLMPYVFPTTEVFDATNLPKNDITMTPISPISSADGTQIWKITHNGVDTHPIHWHLYDVQLLDRVTWDNIVMPPDANELGWKDTIRISPLEDTIIAVRPVIPYLPFELPNSVRDLSPMHPEWSGTYNPAGDNNASLGDLGVLASASISDLLALGIPPSSPQGEPIDVLNHLVNFGWEYVYHCHILSHEEMDMMHPVSVAMPPLPPTIISVVDNYDGTGTLSWTDNSIAETAYVVEKLVAGAWTQVNQQDRPLADTNTAGDILTYADPLFVAGDQYRVLAQNTVGDTWNYAGNGNQIADMLPPGGYAFPVVTAKSAWVYSNPIIDPPAAPSALNATTVTSTYVDLVWTDNASIPNNEDGYVVERSTDGGLSWLLIGQTTSDVTTFSDATVIPGVSYLYRVIAFNGNGDSAPAVSAQVDVPNIPPADPANLFATTVTSTSVALAWTDNASNEDGFRIERSDNAGATWNPGGTTAANVTGFSDISLIADSSYMYRVYAYNAVGDSANPAGPITVKTPAVATLPAAPSNLTVTGRTRSSLTVRWQDNSSNETGFTVQIATDRLFTRNVQNLNVGANPTADYTIFPLAPNTRYYIRVSSYNGAGQSAWTPEIVDKTLK